MGLAGCAEMQALQVATVVPTTLRFVTPLDGRRERTADGTIRHTMMPSPMNSITVGKVNLDVRKGRSGGVSSPPPLSPLATSFATAFTGPFNAMTSWVHGEIPITADPDLVVPPGGFPEEGEVVHGTAAFSSGMARTVGRNGQTLSRALRLWWRLPEAVTEANHFGMVSHLPACELCSSEFLVQTRAGRSHADMLVTPKPQAATPHP